MLVATALTSCGILHRHAARGGATGSAAAGDIASTRDAIFVQSAIATEGDLTAEHVASGIIVPVTQSNVAARVSGVVKTVYHPAGTWVKRDEVVVKLDDSQLKLSVDSARAALETAGVNVQKAKAQNKLAELTLSRDRSLIKNDLIPQSQLDVDTTNAVAADEDYHATQAAVDQAQVQLKQAELNLHYALIRAPFAGQLAAVNVNPGEFVGQNTPVFVLASPDREIDFKVPPGDAAALAEGTAVSFDYQGRGHPAYVSQAPSTPINGVVPIVALLRSRAQLLPFGSVGSVSYRLSLARAVIVPISSVQTSGNQDYVFAIEDGKAVERTLTVVAESGTSAAVQGLTPGTRLIVNPPPGLLRGSTVSFAKSGTTNG